jgi:hypothetical protein
MSSIPPPATNEPVTVAASVELETDAMKTNRKMGFISI